MRILLAGILGGIAMFVWTLVAHMALPLGQAGINEIPNESAVLGAMKSSIDTTGLYIFPGLGVAATAVVAIQNVISWRQSDPIFSILVRCHTRDFFFSS